MVVVCAGADLRAQGVRLDADIGFAHVRPPTAVQAEPASYLLLGFGLRGHNLFASADGALAPDAAAASWARGLLGAQLDARPARWLAAGLTLAGSAFTVGEPTHYRAATVRALPELRFGAGRTRLTLGAEGALGRSDVEDRSRIPPRSVVSDLWMYGARLELSHTVGRLTARFGGRANESEVGTFGHVYLGAHGPLAAVQWAVELGAWDAPSGTELHVNVRATVPLDGSWRLNLGGGRAGPDPLLGTAPSAHGSAVLSWTPIRPDPVGPRLYTLEWRPRPTAVFELREEAADSVAVIGDFSAWRPIAMKREDGVWRTRVPVTPGVYHFGFLVDGRWYVPDDAPGRVTDEFGRANATLVVPDRQ